MKFPIRCAICGETETSRRRVLDGKKTCNACYRKQLRVRRSIARAHPTQQIVRSGKHNPSEGRQRQTRVFPEGILKRTFSPHLDWRSRLYRLAQKWYQAEQVLLRYFPAHGNLLTSSRGASGSEPTEPELNRMEAAAECWRKNPSSQTCIVRANRALIDTITDVEHTAAAIGDLIIPCTQGGTLVGKGGVLHILAALGKALKCADHERGDIECVGLSDVEEAVRNFETERYLPDNWERDKTLMANTRRVKDILDRAQSNVLFSDLVAGCRTLCADYRQAKWVVARAITESSILVTGDITTTSLILAMRKSRFGSHGLASSSGIQCHVIIDVPMSIPDEIPALIPWMQLTDTGQIQFRSGFGGWYVRWSQTFMYRGYLWPEYSDLSQEEAAAIVAPSRTLIRHYPTYIRTRTSLSVNVVCKIGWFVLNAPTLLQALYKEFAKDSDVPNPNSLGIRVIDFLREWDLYEALAEQGVTERSIGYIVTNTENVCSWASKVVERCLRSIGGAGVVLISTNGSTLHCTGAGSPMVDGQEKLQGSGFFLEHDGHTTQLMTKQGILEAMAPICGQTQMSCLLHGIHAVCDQLYSSLGVTPDFSALRDLGDFSYRRRLQLVPGAYSPQRGQLDEEEALNLRKNWLWVSEPDRYLVADHETIAVEGTGETADDT